MTEDRRKQVRMGLIAAVVAAAGLVLGVIFGSFVLWQGGRFEDLEKLETHKPALFTKIYSKRGELIDIISSERRIILDFEDIPKNFVHALVAVEDEDYFDHIGVSPFGILSAVKDNVLKNTRRGASTLTQQLVKNITKDKRFSYKRKLKEQFLAVQLELRYTKEEIFAMYVNEVPFGNNQFGIEAAARYYFGKTVGALSLEECATLAGLLQAPSRYNPYRNPDECLARRNVVLDRMGVEGYVDRDRVDMAKAAPLELRDRNRNDPQPTAAHFVDMVREYLFDKYGEETVRTSGWDVHTTLDIDYQRAAEKAVGEGLKDVDKQLGYRRYDCPSVFKGPRGEEPDILNDYYDPTWRAPMQEGLSVRGVVMSVEADHAMVRVDDRLFRIEARNVKWVARRIRDLSKYFNAGDAPLFHVVARDHIDAAASENELDAGYDEESEEAAPEEASGEQSDEAQLVEEDYPFTLELDQEPEIEGAMLAVDPRSGDLLAMVGGYDYRRSKFNRATQAKRQVGSAFKPVVFGAALEKGFTLSDILFDEPTVFVDPTKFEVDEETGEIEPWVKNADEERKMRLGLIPTPVPYEPHNYYNRYVGRVTLRDALAQSKNIVSVKLLNAAGYDNVLDYALRLDLDEHSLQPYPSLALGAMEMTLQEMAYAYSAFANKGVRYQPRFISLIMDAKGRVIEENPPKGIQAISPQNAYLIADALTSAIEDDRGTARRAQRLRMPLAGKTGTTNDYTDAWFLGFNPEIVVGVWVGRDLRHTIGRNRTGTNTALPLWIRFFESVKASLDQQDFVMPEGLTKVPIDKFTGKKITRDCDCEEDGLILETYIRGTEPTEICSQEEKERQRLPWYLQKRAYQYDYETGEIKPARVMIDNVSQRRATRLLTDAREKDEKDDA